MKASRLPRIVRAVESRLADFYDFAPASEAATHLVTRAELEDALGTAVERLPEFGARGGVFVQADQSKDELFVGIHLDEQIRRRLEARDPTVRLDDDNLDAFCVLIEEVSHFHLILNRAAAARGVSKLELEWQGEIDKLLVCAITLKEQQGDHHVEPLARRLYDGAAIVAADRQLYWEATRHAARFWRAADRTAEPLGPRVRDVLKYNYRVPWDDKRQAS